MTLPEAEAWSWQHLPFDVQTTIASLLQLDVRRLAATSSSAAKVSARSMREALSDHVCMGLHRGGPMHLRLVADFPDLVLDFSEPVSCSESTPALSGLLRVRLRRGNDQNNGASLWRLAIGKWSGPLMLLLVESDVRYAENLPWSVTCADVAERMRETYGDRVSAKLVELFSCWPQLLRSGVLVCVAIKLELSILNLATREAQEFCLVLNPVLLTLLPHFSHDPVLVFSAVSRQGRLLQFATPALRADANVVSAAVGNDGTAFAFASRQLRDNEGFVERHVVISPSLLEHASERLRDRESVVLRAVRRDGSTLRHASTRLRDSEQIVKAAVAQDGRALEWVSERLRDDYGVVLSAVQNSWEALEFASRRLGDVEAIVLEAVLARSRAGPWFA
jgi:hypothetical protein